MNQHVGVCLSRFRTNSQPECICLLCCWKWWICEHLCFGCPWERKYNSQRYHFHTGHIRHKFVYFTLFMDI